MADLSRIYSVTQECENIVRFSPVAWQHINLIGMYEFGDSAETLGLQGIVESLINDLKSVTPL